MRALLLAFLLSGCGVAVSDPPEIPACGWVHNLETNTDGCSGPYVFSSRSHFELLDDGASACWVYDSVCVSKAATKAIPAECRRTYVTCEPTASLGQP